MVYANSATKDGQPIMSPPKLIDGLTQLDQIVKTLEQTICDIIGEHSSKTKVCKILPNSIFKYQRPILTLAN